MVIGKCTDVFRMTFSRWGGGGSGGGGYVGGGSFIGGIYHEGREFPWRGVGFSSII